MANKMTKKFENYLKSFITPNKIKAGYKWITADVCGVYAWKEKPIFDDGEWRNQHGYPRSGSYICLEYYNDMVYRDSTPFSKAIIEIKEEKKTLSEEEIIERIGINNVIKMVDDGYKWMVINATGVVYITKSLDKPQYVARGIFQVESPYKWLCDYDFGWGYTNGKMFLPGEISLDTCINIEKHKTMNTNPKKKLVLQITKFNNRLAIQVQEQHGFNYIKKDGLIRIGQILMVHPDRMFMFKLIHDDERIIFHLPFTSNEERDEWVEKLIKTIREELFDKTVHTCYKVFDDSNNHTMIISREDLPNNIIKNLDNAAINPITWSTPNCKYSVNGDIHTWEE